MDRGDRLHVSDFHDESQQFIGNKQDSLGRRGSIKLNDVGGTRTHIKPLNGLLYH